MRTLFKFFSALCCFPILACLVPSLIAESTPAVPIATSIVFPSLESPSSGVSGKVEIMAAVSPNGVVASVEILSSTNERLDELCLNALRQWRFVPARRSGGAVIGMYRQLFRYEDGEPLYDRKTMDLLSFAVEAPSASEDIFEKPQVVAPVENLSRVVERKEEPAKGERGRLNAVGDRVTPVTSKVLARLSGTVNVAFEVSREGEVKDIWIHSSDQKALNLPSLDAARKWTFKGRQGSDVSVTVMVPFHYTGSDGGFQIEDVVDAASPAVESQPVVLFEAPVELGAEDSGFVDVNFVVDELGYVSNAEFGLSSSNELAEKVRLALFSYRYKPGLSRGKAIATRVKKRFEFDQVKSLEDSLDKLPEMVSAAKPRIRRSLVDLKGHVLMHLRIDEKGNVVDARVMESSHEALVKPTREASERCVFRPGYKDGIAVESTIVIPFFFPMQEGV